jgi:hypothetical protein
MCGTVALACAPPVRVYDPGSGGSGGSGTSSSMDVSASSASSGAGGDGSGSASASSAGGAGGGTCIPDSGSPDQGLVACQSPPVTQCAPAFILWSGQSGAQSFTPSLSGKLTKVRLRVSNPAYLTNILQVSIVKGGASPSWLAGRSMSDVTANTIAESQVSGTKFMDWQDFVFTSPPDVVQGQPYVIVLQLNGPMLDDSVHAMWGEYNFWQGAMTDSYLGGRAFGCGKGCSTWNEEPLFRDHEFEAYVASNCP